MKFFKEDVVAKILFIVYVILFLLLAIHPYDRSVWWAENIPLVIIVGTLVVLYIRGIRFSWVSYLLMSVLIFIHTIGGYYTFERVPFNFIDQLLNQPRNNYDRYGHFSVGFYTFAIMEGLLSYRLAANKWVAFFFGVFAIGFVAASYEIIEWLYAATSAPSSGASFLGSQGDIWDAQKDMLADICGAIVAGFGYLIFCKDTNNTPSYKSLS